MTWRYVKRADTRDRRGVERLAGAINLHGKPSAEITLVAGAKR
jgi:hypothetical protein